MLKRLASKNRRDGWLFGAAFVLLVQSLYPSGYMPGNLADGWLVVLCPEGLPGGFVPGLEGHAHHGGASSDDAQVEDRAVGYCQLGSGFDLPVAPVAEGGLAEPALPSFHPGAGRSSFVNTGVAFCFDSRAPPLS